MCGRFTLTADMNILQESFPWLNIPEGLGPRYNIAPTQPVAVVPNDGKNKLDFFTWGLIPSWSKDPKIGSRMINARAETLAEKPSFRTAFKRRRCLILADGFYEWRQEGKGLPKTPMYIKLTSGKPFAFAGLWESWNSKDGSNILSCTIMTTRTPVLCHSSTRCPAICEISTRASGSTCREITEQTAGSYLWRRGWWSTRTGSSVAWMQIPTTRDVRSRRLRSRS